MMQAHFVSFGHVAHAAWGEVTRLGFAWTQHLPYAPMRRTTPLRRSPALVWLGAVSDTLVAMAYGLLLSCLVWGAVRLRQLRGFRANFWTVFWFEMLILACGASRVMGVASIWWALYPVTTAIKVACALAAVPAAVLFARGTPALAKNIRAFVESVARVEYERDEAVSTLGEWELISVERQKAAEEVAYAYSQLSAALEYTSDMVMTIGKDWSLLYGNRKTVEALPDFGVGKIYWACFPDTIGTITEESLRKAMDERVPTRYEIFYPPYERWFRVHVFPTDEGISCFFSDVTEDHKIREQLDLEQILREKRIEALSHMAGGLAHEISNPLAIIHAKASDLKEAAALDPALSGASVVEVCTSIVTTSDRALGILRGLRGFAREASNDPMEWTAMETIVEQCLELQESRYERHGVELRVKVEAELPLLLCREVQIGQIVTNLLNNAFDAIEMAGSMERWVELSVVARDGAIWLEVSDSGPGIEEQFKAHLMEPFFTTKGATKGMGVGLSLSRAIAEDHGGSLSLVETCERTCFRLVLPAGAGTETRQVEEMMHGAG